MTNKIYFTPGPSELYPTISAHMATAMANKIGSISHRSQQFKDIYAHAVTGLRQLLQLPANWDILFVSSANEVWERAIQNNVEKESFHLVNGSFSKRFYEISLELGRKATKHEAPFGQGFSIADLDVPKSTELIAVVQNETSSGASTPVADINLLRAKVNSEALIYVDAVSSAPYPEFDFNLIDSTYFSVQKGFGLPAGLGIWLVNDRCVAKAVALKSKGLSIGSFHSIPSLLSKARTYQNPETPNVLAIYLLGKVLEEMNHHGAATIRQETETKAKLIYDYLATSQNFDIAVAEPTHRSQTTIIANTKVSSAEVIKKLAPFDMVIGSGYGNYKDTQIRIANFPAHSLAQVQALVYKLQELFN
ncbi:aminotransferase class V-fold PLP-dependent enzyme [Adhaeribacter radiodurans]|uniref:Alanine--glyoxylate aminotransferase family protein n=1 Tax=Adhaeribacter radiodurans TaxID=2745197 RepID=A0A7L7L448_9BACT|nr:aminotransferase class V-fold PLP-dependent enzyme [Adhaeribacter radiodurans]QMU27588.1 alanine--glyoxylate aminotransferase family protein [Adhaeribacter radiodurans]